jgi:hypothetical protein
MRISTRTNLRFGQWCLGIQLGVERHFPRRMAVRMTCILTAMPNLSASMRLGKRRWNWNRLAEEVDSRKIDDFIAASIENGLQHEKAKALGFLVGDRWRHRKLLIRHQNLD